MRGHEGIEKYDTGQFSPMEGEDVDPEELKKATRRLKEKRSGRNPDGSFTIDEADGPEEAKKENQEPV